jgi:hypothetical protein
MFDTMLREEQKLFERGKLDPYQLAQTCALAGDRPCALKYLKMAYDQHDELVTQLSGDHSFDRMRDEPAIRQLTAEFRVRSAKAGPNN